MKNFNKLLAVCLLVFSTNNYVWFALVFWAYLTTQNVISTSIVGGVFLVGATLTGFWFGSIVDHHKKKTAMMGSSIATLSFFVFGFLIFTLTPSSVFNSVASYQFWTLVIVLLGGSLSGGIYNIAIPTLIGHTLPEEDRDKANGKFGMINGLSFGITSVASGLVLGFFGMYWVLLSALVCTVIAIITLVFVEIPERKIIHVDGQEPEAKKIDIKGSIKAIKLVPGLFALIFFTTFNNFLGGVFMALMDAYGLTLVSVQVWGAIWGALSFGFILGGMYIAKYGLGTNPIRTLFLINIIMWVDCILFTIQPTIVLLVIGMIIWMPLVPFVEATEQTIMQKVVPPERLGRVFGFAHSVEQAASPLTAFMIGPIAQFVFIPFMTTGTGVELIGDWFGVGKGRGIALVFMLAGLIGLIVTIFAMKSRPAKALADAYLAE
ncbi:MAG: MFS transporter [bacterium]|nr:MFS transporter [bacterium]